MMASSHPNHKLELLLLGGFAARLDGVPIAGFSYGKMRALLAYLAMKQEREHSREALAELLWSDVPPLTARGNLRRTLSDLRRVLEAPLGMPLFSTSKHTIRFLPEIDVDAVAFARTTHVATGLPQATPDNEERLASLYRGEFLAGLNLPDCPAFNDWLLMQREALHLRALALFEKLANERERECDFAGALHFALRLTELDPWNEDAHRRMMRLYALSGQKSAALLQYETCCRLLKAELGLLPGKETQLLVESIQRGGLLPTASPSESRLATGLEPGLPVRVAVVEDVPEQCAVMVEFLQLRGFAAQGFESAEAFYQAWPAERFDLLLLDVALPGASGLEVARRVRQRDAAGIVMLTAQDADSDQVAGLGAGADAYLSKRSSLEVVEATCHSVLRRLGMEST